MKILDSTKALSTLVSDNTNGLGQIQPLSCTVTEELNGIYELDFTVSVNDPHYEDLKNSGLVKVEVGDGSEQIFRVYRFDEPINLITSVHCQHITYDLSKIVVKPFSATGAVNIKNGLITNMLGSYPFSTWTDITNTTSTFTNDIPRYFRECLGGYEGSVLDVLRPEYEWDNLTVKLHAKRGADNGVRIAYGKNLVDYSQEQNNENVYDAVFGYAVVDEVEYHANNYYNKTGASYPRVLNVDFSSKYESGEVPTSAELLQYATDYAANNSIEVPSINIKIDFVPLWQTEEYKNILPLERVSLGDTVHVYFDKLGVEASSRVIKTEWNVLTKKYDSIELGDAKANLNTIITDSISTAVDDAVSNVDIDVGYIEQDLNDMAQLIINGLGLYITKEALPSGGYRFYLHNQPTLAQSDVQYYMSASGLMVSTDGGANWTTGYDVQTGELIVQALSTITLRALQIYGAYIEGTQIRFGDPSNKNILVQPYSSGSVSQGITFDGSGTVRFQPQEQFLVNNQTSGGSLYNQLIMRENNINLINYTYYSGTRKPANQIDLYCSSNFNYIELTNKYLNSENIANNIRFYVTEDGAFTEILNGRYYSGSSYYTLNNIQMGVQPNGNSYIEINNVGSTGTVYNYIKMKSDGTLKLYSGSDALIESYGAVRLTSSNSQDITLTAADDLSLSWADKLYLNNRQIYFSGGYVRYYE